MDSNSRRPDSSGRVTSSSKTYSKWRQPSFISSVVSFIILVIAIIPHQAEAQYRPQWPDPMLKREIFILNLEDGYFGCQVNDSADFLQLFELSKLCDGIPQCFKGSDELAIQLKCTDRNQCHPKIPKCANGVCLDGLCYCDDGFGGKGCDLPDENECKYRPCDVFAHCTNTMGSFYCSCFPGYDGDGFSCHDINECEEPALAALCADNAECCNLPGHFVCKCQPGYTGNATESCTDIDECLDPNWCGRGAICTNTPGSAHCQCPLGFTGDPTVECWDIDECKTKNTCGPNAKCFNTAGDFECECKDGYEKIDQSTKSKCRDINECLFGTYPCGNNTKCINTDGSHSCVCNEGFIGDASAGCRLPCDEIVCGEHAYCEVHEGLQAACMCDPGFTFDPNNVAAGCVDINECDESHGPSGLCGQGALCTNVPGRHHCYCPAGFTGDPFRFCEDVDECSRRYGVYGQCGTGAVCQNTPGSFDCTCPTGYTGDPRQGCYDIDECAKDFGPNGKCGISAFCTNIPGSYACRCPPGSSGDPFAECIAEHFCDTDDACLNNAICKDGKCLCPAPNVGDECKHPCEQLECGEHAKCQLDSDGSPICLCDLGFMTTTGNQPGCVDINECLEANPCGTGAECTNIIGSYQCSCPAGTIGNPLQSCQPPPKEGAQCTTTSSCPQPLVCYHRACRRRDTCTEDSFCSPENACSFVSEEAGNQCVDPCDIVQCGPNAYCGSLEHKASCYCNESFTGNPNDIEFGCSPLSRQSVECESDDACGENTVCQTTPSGIRACVDPCENVQCAVNAECKVTDRRPDCVCSDPYSDGNPYDATNGCFIPSCIRDGDCSEEEVCAKISNRKAYSLRECQNVCRGYKCGTNALCRGDEHKPVCECRGTFKGDPYDTRVGCQPAVPSCSDDSACPDYQACRRKENGLRNCTAVCDNVRCGLNAHCVGRGHQAACECLPGFIGDAVHGCQKPPQHLCDSNTECSGEKHCILSEDGIRDCVDCCYGQQCPDGAFCVARDHQAQCDCLTGYTRMTNDTQGRCAPNLCQHSTDCREDQVCALMATGVLDCVDACRGVTCGSNAQCNAKNHLAICGCKEGFEGNADDLRRGCRPRDECATDNDCRSSEVCRLSPAGIKVCLDGCAEDPCGANANCVVSNHFVICQCQQGYTGQPEARAIGCQEIQAGKVCNQDGQCMVVDDVPHDKDERCSTDASCSPGEICEAGQCLFGCRLDSDCTFDKACFNSKCVNPCSVQSPCGQNADCQPVVHRPRCTCLAKYAGNPYDYCEKIPETPPPECATDEACGRGQICEYEKCIEGCRFDESCPTSKACINRQCLNPCSFPEACGEEAECQAVTHRPHCSCGAGFTGDPNIKCIPTITPVCLHDSDCGSGTICETGKCIDACRTDDTCPYAMACVNRRCQDPCSVFGACGRNALCRSENHRAVCSCPPEFRGNANTVCDREEVQMLEQCTADSACQFGFICETGACVEGCRNDDQCTANTACYNRKCRDPCSLGTSCGENTNCASNSHRPVCTCKAGFVGDPTVDCRPLRDVRECEIDQDCGSRLICEANNRCVIGCRNNQGCADGESCINRLCQNPCSFYGVCGRNAQCLVQNHTTTCQCPEGFRGNPNTVCTEAPPQCTKDSECVLGQICENSQCFLGCRFDNNCPEQEACVNGQCTNPCLLPNSCGSNSKCTPYGHRPRCECNANHLGNPYVKCEPIPDDYCDLDADCPLGKVCDGNRCIEGCHSDANCKFEQACINKVCQNPCNIFGACGINAVCKPSNHDRVCSCLADFTGDPKSLCERIKPPPECTADPQCPLGQICSNERCLPGCRESKNCPDEQSCYRNRCINACSISGVCGRGATCTPSDHVAVCSCPSGFRGDPDVECKEIPPECRQDDDCGNERICLKQKCIVGCRTHSNCPYDKACVNGFCQSPCDIGGMCGVNTICRAEKHEAHCSCSPGYTGDPLRQCSKIFVECDADIECGSGYVCAHNQCKDINECLKETFPCGPGASCQNKAGWFKCSCPGGLIGNAYGPEGCHPLVHKCFHDADCPNEQTCNTETQECDICSEPGKCVRTAACGECPTNKRCDETSGQCYDPCSDHKCGTNALCRTENHEPTCYCPPGHEGYPNKVCLPIVECGVTYNCPGNLICLDSHTCGCPPTFFRENDYCFIRTQNCTTKDPCAVNEECVYTGDASGFCVCPHGYELLPYGECRAIKLCEENPCAPGAICKDKPGSYECNCPVDTIGDPYVKGCQPIVGCTTDHDCPFDRECDSSKQCISPCHVCGPDAECTVSDHQAICVCTHGKVGEPYNKDIGCFTPPPPDTPPEVRTIPPVQDLQVMCLADGVQVNVQLGGYDGLLYVKGHSNDAACRRIVTSNELDTIDFKVLFGQCGLIHVNGEAAFILVVQKHPRLVTYRARAYHIKCVYATGEREVTLGFNVSMITTSGTIANTGPPPTCLMSICTLEGKEVSSAEIGDDLLLKVDVQPDFIYGGFARSCVAKTMEDDGEFQYEVTDANGCATDPSIFGNWEYDPHQKTLMARFNAFKFPSSNNLRFQCNIRVCFGSCPPVNCDGVDAYGRRRKRQVRDEDLVLTDSFKEGALREEIMVQSNAILTFERREPQPSSNIEGPRIEDIDHVCLPKLGLILSMIITTLLALVAVAVAISCWLMAYRRRPKRQGPLPHPPDFPNPLYTTPEPVAEPSPDYYPTSQYSM
ncbi:Latent-transforming growth factor beta-binding protein 4 [Halotydeus destructor]|nr:Latent-transforming growth factor beta-binding protein 4 [Halotydeus destructor]